MKLIFFIQKMTRWVPLNAVLKTCEYFENCKVKIKDTGGHFSNENFYSYQEFICNTLNTE